MNSTDGRDLGVKFERIDKSRSSEGTDDGQNSPLLDNVSPSSMCLNRPEDSYLLLNIGDTKLSSHKRRLGLAFVAGLCLLALLLAVAGTHSVQILHSSKVDVPNDEELAPLDEPMGMDCPMHGALHFVSHLAGPWGLPIVMDGRADNVHRNMFYPHATAERAKVHRAIVFFDLNHPKNTYCKLRNFLNDYGGHHVTAFTVGFPSLEKTRGLGPWLSGQQPCAAQWNRDFMWLANQNATAREECSSHQTPTPCELLMGLVRRLRPPEFPNIKNVRVLGFSAGGQMLDKCLYSHSRFFPWNEFSSEPKVKFVIVSPSTLFYPMPERAILPLLPQLDCEYFSPRATLRRDYDFRELTWAASGDLANMSDNAESWYCHRQTRAGNDLNRHECEQLNGHSKMYVYRYRHHHESDEFPGCLHKGLPCNCCRKAKDSEDRQRRACHHYNRYRYGLNGKLPVDFPQFGPCTRESCPEELRAWIRQALLERHAVYIAGSADVCNWELQSDKHFQPSCGWCSENRSRKFDDEDDFARDKLSPVVDSCRALWEGFTRLERMKVYKEALHKVLAPRLGISAIELARKREFYTLIGVGHFDNSVLERLAPFLIDDNVTKHRLVAIDMFT